MSENQFRAGGIVSGIDSNALIEQLVNLERLPIRELDKKNAILESQQGKFRNLNTRLNALASTSKNISTVKGFLSLKTTTSDEKLITATATGEANAGNYHINVMGLASSHRVRSDTITGNTTINPNDEFTITVDGAVRTITLTDATPTLESIASSINAKAGDVVSATVVVNPANNQQTLFVESINTGVKNVISFADTVGTPLQSIGILTTGPTPAIKTEVVAAADSSVSIDGITANSSSNQPSDIIKGVTLNFLKTTPVPHDSTNAVTISIAPNTDNIISNIKAFTSKYNDIITAINAEFKTDEDNKVAVDSLSGDSTLRSVKSRLQTLISSQVPGLTGAFTALARVGIKSEKDGTLSVDETKVRDNLKKEFQNVANVFVVNDDLGTKGMMKQFVEMVEGYKDANNKQIPGFSSVPDGLIQSRIDGIAGVIKMNEKQMAQIEIRVKDYEKQMIDKFTNLETTMSTLQLQGNFLAARR